MIRLIRPYISFDEVEGDLRTVFESGIFTRGNHVDAFRQELTAYTGAAATFLATSATTALWLCLKRLGVGPGDEVIVSDFSFPATANVVEDLGATPVFSDVSAETFNMTVDKLESRITKRTKAVIFVDALGNPTGLNDIAELCKSKSIPLVEDAACAIGSAEDGRRCGSVADLTCFSFHPRKLLTTGEGGAIAVNDAREVAWFDTKLSHGAAGTAGSGLDFVDFGYNFRLSEPQAVMGRVQLRKLDSIIAERNAARSQYIDLLTPLGFIPQHLGENVIFNVQSLVFLVPSGTNRDRLIEGLRTNGVESTLGTYSLSNTRYYRNKYNDVQTISAMLQERTITLPCYGDVDVERVSTALKEVVENG